MPDIRDVAAQYIARGWAVVPIPYQKKGPEESGWQTLTINAANYQSYFNGSPANIGVLLGPRSGGLTDLDLDCQEAVELAGAFLPDTGAVFGRASKPASHWLYILTDATDKAVFKFLDPDKGELIGLRTGGGDRGAQTVFPGSTHECGELIEWVKSGEPKEISFQDLKRATVKLAVASLVLRNWPAKGRHEAALRISGLLARSNWEKAECEYFVEQIATAANDEELEDRIRAAGDAWEGHNNGSTSYGLPAIKEIFGDKAGALIARWLDFKESDSQSRMEEMNAKYWVVPMKGKVRVLTFEPEDDRLDPVFYTFEEFSHLLDNNKVSFLADDGKPRSMGLGKWWLAQPKRQQVKGLVFKPGQPKLVAERINLWQGWGIEPAKGKWSLMREHIRSVLAAGVEQFDEYIFKWAAWSVQNPGDRAEVAIVFKGGRGIGKGIFARELVKMFGQHGLHISSVDQLAGRFNAHLMDCAMLLADEAYWPGDKGAEGTLKRLITEPTLTIERKGIDIASSRNCLHIIMTANEDWVVPAGLHERRFAVFNASEQHQQNFKYFGHLQKEIESGGTAAMLFDLLNVDLAGWHPRFDIPRNEALTQQQIRSLKPEDQWWLMLLEGGALPGNSVSHLTRTSLEAIMDHARTSVPRLRNLGELNMTEYLKSKGCVRHKSHGQRFWLFPDLKLARAEWDKQMPMKWTDADDWTEFAL